MLLWLVGASVGVVLLLLLGLLCARRLLRKGSRLSNRVDPTDSTRDSTSTPVDPDDLLIYNSARNTQAEHQPSVRLSAVMAPAPMPPPEPPPPFVTAGHKASSSRRTNREHISIEEIAAIIPTTDPPSKPPPPPLLKKSSQKASSSSSNRWLKRAGFSAEEVTSIFDAADRESDDERE